MDVKELRADVEKRLRNGESYSIAEIRKIMKSTGLSYTQVITRAKKLKKDMEKAEEEAKKNGEEFDKEAYINKRMNG